MPSKKENLNHNNSGNGNSPEAGKKRIVAPNSFEAIAIARGLRITGALKGKSWREFDRKLAKEQSDD